MCTLSLYDVIGITRCLHFKLKSFSNTAQPLHKEAVRGYSFLYIIAKKSVIISEKFLVDVSIHTKYQLDKVLGIVVSFKFSSRNLFLACVT